MRWIFISLVLMNLAYLGYELSKVEAPMERQESVTLPTASHAKSLVLLSETAKPAPRKNRKQNAEEALCWAVGSFPTELAAKHVYARMVALDINAKVSPKEKVLKKEFWVYLPPLPNKKQALRKLKELQRRKVDSYVITEGELANGISLGLFGKQESVDRLVESLKKKQINPEVKSRDRTKTEYWVVAPVDGSIDMDDTMRNRLQGDQVDLDWQQIRCHSSI